MVPRGKHEAFRYGMSSAVRLLVLAGIALSSGGSSSAATFDIILTLEGIRGESLLADAAGAIDLLGFSYNGTVVGDPFAGTVKPTDLNKITVTKYFDTSSPPLIEKYLTGRVISSGVLQVRSKTASRLVRVKITMTNIYVLGTKMETSGARPVEMVSLEFQKGEWCSSNDSPAGVPGAPVCFSIDFRNIR